MSLGRNGLNNTSPPASLHSSGEWKFQEKVNSAMSFRCSTTLSFAQTGRDKLWAFWKGKNNSANSTEISFTSEGRVFLVMFVVVAVAVVVVVGK